MFEIQFLYFVVVIGAMMSLFVNKRRLFECMYLNHKDELKKIIPAPEGLDPDCKENLRMSWRIRLGKGNFFKFVMDNEYDLDDVKVRILKRRVKVSYFFLLGCFILVIGLFVVIGVSELVS